MDRDRFDSLTKTFVTRRTGVGLALAGLLGFVTNDPADAKKKKPCGPCKRRKNGKCKPKPNGAACGPGKTCTGGNCTATPPPPPPPPCPTGQDRCNGACVDLASDPDYCGTCDIACGFDQDCDSGACCGSEGASCTNYDTCCSQSCDFLVGNGTCGSSRGQFCNAQYPCHEGYACTNSRCDGCIPRATVCNGSVPCCNSRCDGGVCLSTVGGRCVNNPDCQTCYFNSANCSGACVGGTCQF